MRWRLMLLLGFAFILISNIRAQNATDTTMRVVVFGDGITLGIQDGKEITKTYGDFLEELLIKEGIKVDVINKGKEDDQSLNATQRMQMDVVTERPDVVTIMFGTFDAMVDPGKIRARVPLNIFRGQLKQMVTYLKQINIVPIIMTTPPMGDIQAMEREPYKSAGANFLLEPYMQACRELAQEERVPLIDHYADWQEQTASGETLDEWLMEGYLPNEAGHRQIAQKMFQVVKQQLTPTMTDVFISGEGGYDTYRIPTIFTSKNGFLLAICEGRSSKADHAQNDIVMKRSFDKGQTWSDLKVLAEDGENSLNNPQIVMVSETGKLILMYQQYPSGYGEKEVLPGIRGDRICRTFVITSEDDGNTWTEPEEVTKDVKRPKDVTSVASGPGRGIEVSQGKKKGRLIMPFNQGPYGAWKVYTVYSDNQGKSWKYGEVAPEGSKGMANEVQMIELRNGNLMLNARSMEGNGYRKIAYSEDDGETWTALKDDSALVEPQCHASFYRFNPYYILFSNPASASDRQNGMIKLSVDDGKTWKYAKTIYPGSFAYSSLTGVSDTYAGVLFERDDYSKITFSRFPIKWLLINEL